MFFFIACLSCFLESWYFSLWGTVIFQCILQCCFLYSNLRSMKADNINIWVVIKENVMGIGMFLHPKSLAVKKTIFFFFNSLIIQNVSCSFCHFFQGNLWICYIIIKGWNKKICLYILLPFHIVSTVGKLICPKWPQMHVVPCCTVYTENVHT